MSGKVEYYYSINFEISNRFFTKCQRYRVIFWSDVPRLTLVYVADEFRRG